MSEFASSERLRQILPLMIAAGLLAAPTPALADDSKAPTQSDPVDAETHEQADPDDPMPAVSSYFAEATEAALQGRYVAAADLYEAAYILLEDPRKYRNSRGTAISQLYNSLLAAYETAETRAARLRHACRLRRLMTVYLDELKAAYGEASEDFPEVYFGSEKLASLDMTIASYGDPDALCPIGNTRHNTVAMIDPGSSRTSPAGMTSSTDDPKPQSGPTDDAQDRRVGPDRDRKAVAMTAVGGSAIGLGTIALGVMTAFIIQSTQRRSAFDALSAEVQMRGADAVLNEEELAYGEQLDLEGMRANKIALSAGISGAAVLATGVVLTAIGRKRMRARELSLVPNANQTSLGATLNFRF